MLFVLSHLQWEGTSKIHPNLEVCDPGFLPHPPWGKSHCLRQACKNWLVPLQLSILCVVLFVAWPSRERRIFQNTLSYSFVGLSRVRLRVWWGLQGGLPCFLPDPQLKSAQLGYWKGLRKPWPRTQLRNTKASVWLLSACRSQELSCFHSFPAS